MSQNDHIVTLIARHLQGIGNTTMRRRELQQLLQSDARLPAGIR